MNRHAVLWGLAVVCTVRAAGQGAVERTPLAVLLGEAESSNSQAAAAESAWKASTHGVEQVTALPDPQFTVQSLSVGSPRPFAGLSNSDFAYLGLGASVDLPYPGKLALRGEVAKRNAAGMEAGVAVVRATVAEQVKLTYLRLAYLEATHGVLERSDAVLRPMIADALSRYSLGQGDQAGVIRAQLDHTKLVREMTLNEEEAGQREAELKALVHRPQESPDIVPEVLAPTRLVLHPEALQAMAKEGNPELQRSARSVESEDAKLVSARRGTRPDFNLAYMLQLTGLDYRNYYMLSLSMRLPRKGRVAGEIAEATEQAVRVRRELDEESQQKFAELQKQYVAYTSSTKLLAEYNEGLIPQAQAVVRSEQTAYASGKQEFAPVLTALLEVLAMERDYQQALLEHESALARLETLTGASLR